MDAFIKDPAADFELIPEQCFILLLPFYDLSDLGDLWHVTIDRNHQEDLGMTPF